MFLKFSHLIVFMSSEIRTRTFHYTLFFPFEVLHLFNTVEIIIYANNNKMFGLRCDSDPCEMILFSEISYNCFNVIVNKYYLLSPCASCFRSD